MIVADVRQVHIVECEGFRNLLSMLEPGFVMPSRKTISSTQAPAGTKAASRHSKWNRMGCRMESRMTVE